MMSTTTMRTGRQPASAPVGMAHALRAQGFDLAAVPFGAPTAPDVGCAMMRPPATIANDIAQPGRMRGLRWR
jgi:hypothetical protein